MQTRDIIARWESRSGKWHAVLSHSERSDSSAVYFYEGTVGGFALAGGVIIAGNEEDAIAQMQAKVDAGTFQPDANKTPMRRVV